MFPNVNVPANHVSIISFVYSPSRRVSVQPTQVGLDFSKTDQLSHTCRLGMQSEAGSPMLGNQSHLANFLIYHSRRPLLSQTHCGKIGQVLLRKKCASGLRKARYPNQKPTCRMILSANAILTHKSDPKQIFVSVAVRDFSSESNSFLRESGKRVAWPVVVHQKKIACSSDLITVGLTL